MKRYGRFVQKVFQHIGGDRDLVWAVAGLYDKIIMEWKSPDEEDYVGMCERSPAPLPFFHDGQLRVNKYQQIAFEENFAQEVFSHEIRSHNSLNALAGMYRRLKLSESDQVPGIVFQNIIRKMLWLCDQEKIKIAG